MPVQVESLPKSGRGREAKYDFSELFDGNVYRLIRGTEDEVKAGDADFSCKPGSLRQTVYRAALDVGHKLSTRTTEHEGREAVAIQRTGPAEQKDAENKSDKSDNKSGADKGDKAKS